MCIYVCECSRKKTHSKKAKYSVYNDDPNKLHDSSWDTAAPKENTNKLLYSYKKSRLLIGPKLVACGRSYCNSILEKLKINFHITTLLTLFGHCTILLLFLLLSLSFFAFFFIGLLFKQHYCALHQTLVRIHIYYII